ncbi:MAG: DEAD/DEAH box helicase [Cellulosilyticum sp.]|nr:DEAD/DEAH box helicase [Cellulosilyticum sp.]
MIEIRYDRPKRLGGQQSIFVTFPYSQEIVAVIRCVPERFWDSKNSVWELDYKAYDFLREHLPNEEFSVVGEPIDSGSLVKKDLEEFSLPESLQTELFSYQRDDYNMLMNFEKRLVLHDTGLGKSIICSAVAEKRRELGLADHTLILCLNTLTVNWYREIKKHFNMESTILGARKDKRGNLIVKSNKDKLEDLKNLKTYFLITNIESLQNKDIVQELVNLCKKKRIMVIEDEIHKGVSNPGTKQGKAFLRLKPKYSLGLSGTLLTNSALNLYTPLKFVDGFKSNYNAFKSHFVIYGGYGGYQVVGYKNLAELQVLVDTYSIKRKKGDVLDLPEINFKNEYLQMGKAQSKIYAEVLEQTLADVDKIVASVNPLSMLMRLRQCTATTEIVSTTVSESIKFDRMEEIIEDVVSRGEKLIVFSNWTQVLDFAKLRLKYDYAVVTGEVKDKQAQLDKFTNDDKCKVLLATIGAAGTGLTLTVANTLLFLDSPWNYATFTQVSSRIHRIGQTKNCDIISLLATNTIDERIMDIVEKKKKLGEAVVDGKYNLKDRKVLEWLLE